MCQLFLGDGKERSGIQGKQQFVNGCRGRLGPALHGRWFQPLMIKA